jgi:hypothetical protein
MGILLTSGLAQATGAGIVARRSALSGGGPVDVEPGR